MDALITVVLLSYRNISGIYESLDSIIKQTYNNIEIVISDDGSPDFSLHEESIRNYVTDYNKGNIKNLIINALPVNQGTVKNINSAISLSNGEFIKSLSSEDCLSSPDSLKNLVSYMDKNQYDVCFGKMRGVTPSGNYVYELLSCESNYDLLRSYTIEQTQNRLFARNFLPAPAWCIRKKIFEKYGLIPEDTRIIEDYPYWLYLTQKGVPFGYLDEVVIDYKMSGETSSGVYGEMFMQDMLIIYKKYIFPNDRRFGFLQPIYNALKQGGLNYYIARSRKEKMTTVQRVFSAIRYFPFICYTTLLDWKVAIKNKQKQM